MVTVTRKLRKHTSTFDIIVEWIDRVDNVNLRCDLMNIGLGQFTYISPTSFSFVASEEYSLDEYERKANRIFRKYSAFGG